MFVTREGWFKITWFLPGFLCEIEVIPPDSEITDEEQEQLNAQSQVTLSPFDSIGLALQGGVS